MTFRIFTMGSNRVLCPTLDIMLKKTILALCEVNVKYNNKLEISGSLHVRSDGGRVFTLLIDEEVMNLANKRDRDSSQGQGHYMDHGRAVNGATSKPASSQGRRASFSSIGGVQMPETSSSSSSGSQHTGAPPGGRLVPGPRLSGLEHEAQSLSSTVPDMGSEACGEDLSVGSSQLRYQRPSSVDNHCMAAVSSANSTDNVMETSRAGSTLDAIVSNLHSAAMEIEMSPMLPNHDGINDHGNNSLLNHMSCGVPTPPYNNGSSAPILNNNGSTEATSPSNSTSPKACSTPEEEPGHIVKVEPSEIPSSSGTPATMPAIGMPAKLVIPMPTSTLDHKTALKLAPVETVKGGNKKWQCVFCGILVSSKFYLSSHINAVHTRTRIYPCEICGKMFYSHGAQRIHKLRNHWVEKRHKCPFCGQLFVLPFELRQHVQKKHRGQAPEPSPQQPKEQTQTTT